MNNKEDFLSMHGLTQKFKELETRNPNLWDELCKIEEHYKVQEVYLKGTMQSFIDSVGCSDCIHSVRYRIKDVESLIVKIIEKKFENTNPESKYEHITSENYFKIITDLVGVRIIIRYRYQWQEIHKMIWKSYHKDTRHYIVNYVNDYFPGKDIFIAEKPIVYYRRGDNKREYEIFGRDVFDIKQSDIGYSSIHYIINVNGTYIELQVRTIYDEAWSECDHDFVYKLNASNKKLVLQRCSKMLSDITGVADTLSTFIKDYYSNQIEENVISITEEIIDKTINEDKQEIIENNFKRVGININKVSDVFDMF